ncbi:MAG: hypothetical protein U0414_30995 [Polyangiaceae bacterium]
MKTPRLLGLAAVLASAACGAQPRPTEPAVSAAAPLASAASPRTPASSGIDAPGNDPEIVRLLRGVLGCHWKVGEWHPKDCAAGVAWDETDLFGDDKSLPTLVSFLEDADPAIRALAAEALRVHGHLYREDAALSARVLGAAEREKDPGLLDDLGDLAAGVDLEHTGLVDRGLALAKTAPLDLREAQVEALLGANRYSMSVFTFVKAALHDPEARIRSAAITALRDADDLEACELLQGELAGKDEEQAHLAARALTYGGNGRCSSSFDAVLGWLEKQPVTKESIGGFAQLTEWLCDDRTASVEQDARATKWLRKVASDTHLEPWARGTALEALPTCDVDSKTFAASLVTDDEGLQSTAATVASAPTKAIGPAPDTVGVAPEPPAIPANKTIQSIDAVSFLTAWDAAPRESLYDLFPPGPYRVEGVVVGVEREPQGRVELSLAGPPGTAIHLHLSGSQAAPAATRRRGQKAKAVCDFHGDGGHGYANFTDCHWEG